MPDLHFPLTIAVPTHVHAGVLREIDEAATATDRTQADAVERWLGELLTEAANLIADKLPDGWNARFGSHYYATPSLEIGRPIYRERQRRYAAELAQRVDDGRRAT